ncbi:hypothetical protein [Cesiribacter sp. SM1]|uniref:hypothetical protein n=1 Tax=Cesiribacter sp. SM1 TaxID=2861196 RepID=UPI001CD6D736|nr:hypothetical protein [Cesiribacter sp. SM1]
MTFKEIYNNILPLWGDTIDFSDAIILEPKKPYTNRKSLVPSKEKEHFYSQKLSSQWNSVEEAVDEKDEWGKLMIWTMYQVFHRHARKKFEQNKSSFSPKEIDRKEIEEQYFRNLSEDGWEAQLAEYERIIE